VYTIVGFFASLKKKSPCVYNFDNAICFASGEKNNGKREMYFFKNDAYLIYVQYNIWLSCIGSIPCLFFTLSFFANGTGTITTK